MWVPLDLPSSALLAHGSLILLTVLLNVNPCDYNDFVERMLLSIALSLSHWTLVVWVYDPTIGGLAWPEGAGVQGLSNRDKHLLASHEEQLVDVLAIGCKPAPCTAQGGSNWPPCPR